MADRLEGLVDGVVAQGAPKNFRKAHPTRDGYRDEYEGDASAGPNPYRRGYSARLLTQVASFGGPWHFDDGEM